MRKTYLLSFLIVLLFQSCVSLSQSRKNPLPEWAKVKPVNSMYYIGIGSAPKIGFAPADYTQTAQQQALGDLSREISINISSESVLSVIEHNYNISENWTSEIKASSDIFLEGYELVETWESKEYYWVYYRLSKSKHAQLKEQRKKQAIADALLKYKQGEKQLENKAYFEAFTFYADALAGLKPYMAENTEVDIDGERKDLAQACFSSMIGILQSIEVRHAQKELNVVRGKNIEVEDRVFTVYDTDDKPVSNIPIELSFSTTNLVQNKYVSDNNGRFISDLVKVTSLNNNETLSAGLDMLAWSRVSKEPMIRNIIRQIPVPKSTLIVNIQKPSFFVESSEKDYGSATNKSILADAMRGALATDNSITQTKNNADFNIQIQSDANLSKSTHRYISASINMTVSMWDNNGELLYQKRFTLEGEGENKNEAMNDAYKEAENTLSRRVIREINTLLYGTI